MKIKPHVIKRPKHRKGYKYPYLEEYAAKKKVSASYVRSLAKGRLTHNPELLAEYRKYAEWRKSQEVGK